MITVKFESGNFQNYSVINPFRTAFYYVPTSRFVQAEPSVRAFRSLKSAAKFMIKVGCICMYQDLASGQYISKGEIHNGKYCEFYSERVKIDKW